VDDLLNYVEKSFKKRLGKLHKDFDDNQYKVKVIFDKEYEKKIELYNINNIFGVGLFIDR
jgi:hypothetical protein